MFDDSLIFIGNFDIVLSKVEVSFLIDEVEVLNIDNPEIVRKFSFYTLEPPDGVVTLKYE